MLRIVCLYKAHGEYKTQCIIQTKEIEFIFGINIKVPLTVFLELATNDVEAKWQLNTIHIETEHTIQLYYRFPF